MSRDGGSTLLDVRDLTVHFRTRDGVVQAVSALVHARRGETLGDRRRVRLGQERHEPARSWGCSTGLTPTSSGEVLFEGTDLLTLLDDASCARSAAGTSR